jgi:phosphoadenosine phosphosulfate reductase
MKEKSILVNSYRKETSHLKPEQILEWLLQTFGLDNFVIANSLQIEDQVLLDLAIKLNPRIHIITLDTGRLPQETFDLIQATEEKYRIKIEVLLPDANTVKHLIHTKGVNLFYSGVENRKECCYVRKVEPLKNRLKGLKAWVCGLRKEQSITRGSIDVVEWDEQFDLIKINPLADWSFDEVWAYINKNHVPFHKLYNQGYTSIGCSPCSRAIRSGGDLRSGRWWWEEPEKKECGLHNRVLKKGER